MVKSKQGYKLYTNDEIISLIKNWYDKNGKIVIRDLRHKNGLPSVTQVINAFGSFQNCLKEADINVYDKEYLFQRECLTDNEMLINYKKFVEEHLKTNIYLPTNDEVDACDYIQCTSVYIRRFSSFEHINELIGYNQKEFNNSALEKDMLFKYKRACKEHGKSLSSRDITRLSKSNKEYIYSTEAYLNHFGTLHNLQEICGFVKTHPGKGASRLEMIVCLQKLGKLLGRRPTQKDLILYDFMPSCSTYISEFGSFKEALKESGYSKINVLKTKNGVKCRSTYELKFAQMLERYNINFENEMLYSTIIPNFKRKYRFDFVLFIDGQKIYVELFGIEGNLKYEKRKQEKINLCRKYNVPLIDLYQKDIYSKSFKEIYGLLFERINKIVKEVA
ncbi:hypothetical protein DS742_14030 [Lacrimispora amygdalina]|uniref:DUF559 domain-containing protein n=1 Tax=Lacrimispora amygdalina TaxID=253257 RepID=A0A3E2NB71_9FIRM|nr:hypothetical protein [Clostridium indicum]RFZ78232.1 hypothetical protein DS742_14030 [Clostridium indicum]